MGNSTASTGSKTCMGHGSRKWHRELQVVLGTKPGDMWEELELHVSHLKECRLCPAESR